MTVTRTFDARHEAVKTFLYSRSMYVVGWGPGGVGKTAAGCLAMQEHAKMVLAEPGCGLGTWPIRGVIIRETRKVIGKTIAPELKYWYPEAYGMSKWTGREDEPERVDLYTKLYLPDGTPAAGGQVFKFGEYHCIGVDSAADLNKLAGMQVGFAWVDEPVSQIADSGGVSAETISSMVLRSRQVKLLRVQLTFNPPGMDNYVHTIWLAQEIDPTLPESQRQAIAKVRARSTVVYFPQGMNQALEAVAPDYAERNAEILLAIGRPDMAARFVEGRAVTTQQGEPVTPEFISRHKAPVRYEPGKELLLAWDFGLHASCAVAQLRSTGQLGILAAFSAPNMGVTQLVERFVHPYLMELGLRVPDAEQTTRVIHGGRQAWQRDEQERLRVYGIRNPPDAEPALVHSGWAEIGVRWRHIIDPAGNQREQSNSAERATLTLQRLLGGSIEPASQSWQDRREGLHEALSRPWGEGMWVQVDPVRAVPLVQALEGGWYYRRLPNGQVQRDLPEQQSPWAHIGNAFAYLVERLLRRREARASLDKARKLRQGLRGVTRDLSGSVTHV